MDRAAVECGRRVGPRRKALLERLRLGIAEGELTEEQFRSAYGKLTALNTATYCAGQIAERRAHWMSHSSFVVMNGSSGSSPCS